MSKVRSITTLPPADFTTELGNYKTLQPFRYWCQKVLPLVYDDSLSYYELLCKVVDYLNKTMEDVETLHGDANNLHTAYEQLQNYVNNYFSTLDVQEEINNKLDNMANSGELYEIIRRYTDPIVNEQNEKINVLKLRMDTFTSLPVGSTVGDAELQDIRIGYNGKVYPSAGDAVRMQVSKLSNEIVDLENIAPNFLEKNKEQKFIWTNGYYIQPSNGTLDVNASYSYTDYISVISGETYSLTALGNVYGSFYDENKNYVGEILIQDVVLHTSNLVVPSTAKYVRLSCPTENIPSMKLSIIGDIYLNDDIYVKSTNVKEFDHVITVSKQGTKQYTSLRSAVESITDSAKDNTYLIEFYGDCTEYDLASEYTTEEQTTTYGLTIPDYTVLRGIGGKDKCIITCRLASENANRYFSTINLKSTSGIENFTLIGDYTRNVIHDDFGKENSANRSIKNCLLRGSNLFLSYIYAGGVRSGCKWNYENCIFEGLTNGVIPYSCHNWDGYTDAPYLKFDNCRFVTVDTTYAFTFRLGSITNGASCLCSAELRGCKVQKQLLLNEENASAFGKGNVWVVSGYANVIDSTQIETTDGKDYSNCIDLI